jgi:hypothetical protein
MDGGVGPSPESVAPFTLKTAFFSEYQGLWVTQQVAHVSARVARRVTAEGEEVLHNRSLEHGLDSMNLLASYQSVTCK